MLTNIYRRVKIKASGGFIVKYTIRQKGNKYYKKLKPSWAEMVAGLIVALAIIYIVFEVIRG